MAESLEEAKIFSGDREEREEEDVEALPTEQTELSKPVSADIDTAKEEEEEEEEKIFSGDGEEREKEDLEAEPTEPTELSKPVLADIDIAELREAASAHYDGLTDDQKEEATRLFNNMDKNEDGDISIDEFKTFLSVAGLQAFNPDNLFAKLDKDGSKSLSFEELKTFSYVLSHDEYKHLLIDKPSTDVRGQEASIAPGTVRGANDKVSIAPGTVRGANDKARTAPGMAQGANDKGHKWTKFLPRLYDKFKGTYKLDELGSENSCTIL
ncbi:uncharacterized protein LOC104414416 isoform X10 [Eucalyptus grandis]|uniref:uncharacterized protein LOC104414416 isoform X10 n=1 Tax=Eucalyptus grandis TaxID=71139 RepID=UPI00192E936B|nr:uncharacterized protein LOC104414416 isoform X10 [Eucalyptus grandis]